MKNCVPLVVVATLSAPVAAQRTEQDIRAAGNAYGLQMQAAQMRESQERAAREAPAQRDTQRTEAGHPGGEHEIPARSGIEDARMNANTETGAQAVGPGRDLIDRSMPAGNRTEQNFPDPPEHLSRDNTTVVVDHTNGDQVDDGGEGNAGVAGNAGEGGNGEGGNEGGDHGADHDGNDGPNI